MCVSTDSIKTYTVISFGYIEVATDSQYGSTEQQPAFTTQAYEHIELRLLL